MIRKISSFRPPSIFSERRAAEGGAPPGTLRLDPDAQRPAITVVGYGPDVLEEMPVGEAAELGGLLGRWPVTWVNVNGLGDAATLKEIGELFSIHPLALEDVVHTPQRSKVEQFDDHLFIVTHITHLGSDRAASTGPGESVRSGELEQVSVFLGKNYVLTLQERAGDCFDPIRERIRAGRTRIRGAGADYLAYALLDAAVDSVFPLLEKIGDRLSAIEQEVMDRPRKTTARAIQEAKREILWLVRFAWPERETMNQLHRDESGFIAKSTRTFLRDCYDHSVQVIDTLQSYREEATGLMDLYLSSLSNRLNDVMKFLTVFASIFIPLSFIAGLYGMNFNPDASPFNMPELNWVYGYPAALALMAAVAGGLLFYLWRRGWIGSDS